MSTVRFNCFLFEGNMRKYAACLCCILHLILAAAAKNVSAAEQQISDLATTQKAAEQGDAKAQSFLGSMYHSGRDVLQDEIKAA
ncbi:MAG: hypothetical protein FWF31_09580 [Desulfobulbus sp.]|nr:hypothetical protein [Desulfobulbus sp.]